MRWLDFFYFKFSNCSPLKLIFSEGFSFFVRFVCNHGALKMRLQVVVLPASFILNAFFNFVSVNFFVATWFMFSFRPWGLVVILFCSPWEEWNFLNFFVWNLQPVSPLKLIFSESPSFLIMFCLLSRGFEKALASGSPASVIGHVLTRRDYIKVEQVRTWLHSSTLAKFHQFYSESFFHFCFS